MILLAITDHRAFWPVFTILYILFVWWLWLPDNRVEIEEDFMDWHESNMN
jgi:cbb3-type cytochrome oxidase subunit 3